MGRACVTRKIHKFAIFQKSDVISLGFLCCFQRLYCVDFVENALSKVLGKGKYERTRIEHSEADSDSNPPKCIWKGSSRWLLIVKQLIVWHSLQLHWFISNLTEFWARLLIKVGKYWKFRQFCTQLHCIMKHYCAKPSVAIQVRQKQCSLQCCVCCACKCTS